MVTWSEIKRRICFARMSPPLPPTGLRDVVHPPHENLLNQCHLWSALYHLYSKKTLHLCVCGAGRKILVSSRLGPRMESAVNMNEQAHDNMSASHGRCENGKRTKKRKWQGSSVSK